MAGLTGCWDAEGDDEEVVVGGLRFFHGVFQLPQAVVVEDAHP